MGEEPQGLGLGRVRRRYYPTDTGKPTSVRLRQAIAATSAPADRDTVCDLFYMECHMARTRKMPSRRQDVWVIPTQQDKPMAERRQPVSSCRKHRGTEGPTTEFSANLHSLPFDSSFITVRRGSRSTRDHYPWLAPLRIFKSWCDLLCWGLMILKCSLLMASYSRPVACIVLPHFPYAYSL